MNSSNPIIDFISTHTAISDVEREQIANIIHFSSYKKNELLLKQGEVPRSIAFITKGALRIYYTDDTGQEQSINFIFENQPFVPFDNFANQTPSAIAVMALEPTEIIWATHTNFFAFLHSFPKYEPALRNLLSQHIVNENEHFKLLRINPARERYEALRKLRPELLTRVPLNYIASFLGLTLETLSRVRAGKL